MEQKHITIYGSCISREPFNQELLRDGSVVIDNYIQKNSIVTLFDDELEIDNDDVIASSNFLKRMTYYDFTKKAAKILKEQISDWLIIDFTELRFGIIRLEFEGIKTSLTNSDSTKKTVANLQKTEKYKSLKASYDENPYWYTMDVLNDYIAKFKEFITAIYPKEKIILLDTHNCMEYIGEDGILKTFDELDKLSRENYIMQQVADTFFDMMNKEILRIRLPMDITGDRKHHLGLHALHYEDSCYKYIANCFHQCFFNNVTQKDLDKLYQEYYNQLKKEKRSIRIKTSIARNKEKEENKSTSKK